MKSNAKPFVFNLINIPKCPMASRRLLDTVAQLTADNKPAVYTVWDHKLNRNITVTVTVTETYLRAKCPEYKEILTRQLREPKRYNTVMHCPRPFDDRIIID